MAAGKGAASAKTATFDVAEHLHGKMVTIFTAAREGTDEKTAFYMHEALLKARSPFFEACLKDCWKGKSMEVDLEEHSAEAFCIFNGWAYLNGIPVLTPLDAKKMSSTVRRFGEAYKLAHFLQCTELTNAIVDEFVNLFEEHETGFGFEAVVTLSELGLEGTRLWQYAIRDGTAHYMTSPEVSSEDGPYAGLVAKLKSGPETCVRFLETIRQYNKRSWTPAQNRHETCAWHDHADKPEHPCAPPSKVQFRQTLEKNRSTRVFNVNHRSCYNCASSTRICTDHYEVKVAERWKFE